MIGLITTFFIASVSGLATGKLISLKCFNSVTKPFTDDANWLMPEGIILLLIFKVFFLYS